MVLKLCTVHVNVFLSSLKIPLEWKNRTVINVPKIHLCVCYGLLASYRNTIHVQPDQHRPLLSKWLYLDCVLPTI